MNQIKQYFSKIRSLKDLFLRKNIRTLFSFVLVTSLICVLYSGMVTKVYAVEYQGEEIGTLQKEVNPEKEIEKVDKRINNLAADDISVKENISISEKYTYGNGGDSHINVSEVIESDESITSGYGIEIDNNFVCWAKNYNDIQNYISAFKDYIAENYPVNNNIQFSYQIKPCICRDDNFLSYSEFLNKTDLVLDKTVSEEVIIEREMPDIYLYGTENKQISEGSKSIVKEIYSIEIHNDEIINREKVSEEIIEQGASAIFITTDKSLVSYIYSDKLYNLSDDNLNFINTILPILIKGNQEYNISVSLGLGQAILESGWGNYHYYNNIYGIKGSINYKTYDSFEQSAEDYVSLIATKSNYSNILTANNYIEACTYINQSGYAGTSVYGEKVKTIIENYDLYIFDEMPVS